ncbi:hypothetical protein ES702_05687 [subsurface metagenome]
MELEEIPDIKKFPYRFEMIGVFFAYNQSDDWKRVRNKVKKRDKGICVDCGKFIGDKGVCHHKHYKNWGKGNREEILSCVYLCKKCHRKKHNNQKTKEITPFWVKREPGLCGFDDIDFQEKREEKQKEKREKREKEIERNKAFSILLDLSLLNNGDHREEKLQKLIKKSSKFINDKQKEEIRNHHPDYKKGIRN